MAFLRLLCDDETHGDHNRTLISEWVGDLLPRAYAASAALLGNGVNPAEALWEARTWIQAEFAESGIETAALDVENKEVAV